MAQRWMVLPGRFIIDAGGGKSPLRMLDMDDPLAALKANKPNLVPVNADEPEPKRKGTIKVKLKSKGKARPEPESAIDYEEELGD